MAIENKGPGGVGNSYGQRSTSQPTKIGSLSPKGIYNEFDNGGSLTVSNNVSSLVTPDGNTLTIEPLPREIFRTVNNVVETVSCPKPSRILDAGGQVVYSFNAAAPAVSGCSAALDSNYINRAVQSYLLTCTATGAMSATWTTSIAAGTYDPTKPYVLSIFNGSAGSTSGFGFSISGSGGKSQSWTVSGTGFRPGWNLIYLAAISDTVARANTTTPTGYADQSGVVQVGASGAGGMANTTITSISINFFSQTSGDVIYVDRFEQATKVKPAIVFTYDQAPSDPGNLMASVIPMFQARGLVGTCRYHSLNDKAAPSNCQQAVAAGWDIVNGTLTRATPVNTVAGVLKEYAQNQNEMSAFGFGKSYWANPPGNNSNSDTEALKPAFRQLGIKYSKGVSHNVVYSGVQGMSNPYSLGTVGINNGSYTVAQHTAYIDAAIAAGTHLIFFQHTLAAQLDLVQLGQILDYAASKKAAGLCDVVTLTGLKDILEGNA